MKGKLTVVVGGGKFGSRAVKIAKTAQAKVIVVDKNINCLARGLVTSIVKGADTDQALDIGEGEAVLLISHGADFLLRLMKLTSPDYIVPTAPGHLMGEIVKRGLEEEGYTVKSEGDALNSILKGLPNNIVIAVDREKSTIIVSYMLKGLNCQVPCPHPKEFCFVTKRPKIGSMYSLLEFAAWKTADVTKIFISRQLAQDVGAIQGVEVRDALKQLRKPQPPYSLAVGTACECHGILNVFLVLENSKTEKRASLTL